MKQLLIPILSRFLIILAFGTMCAESCAKDPVNPPEEEDNGKPDEGEEGEGLVSFNDFELGLNQGETIEIPLAGEWNLPVKDFAEGDEITIKLRYDAATSWTFVCTEADNTSGAFFSVPDGFRFIGGMCDVSVSANGRTPQGQVFVSVTDSGPVEQKAGYTSYGRVIDYEGNPVPGVAVSDGEIVTTTDDKGQYYLRSEKEEGFVFISVPKNYRVAVNRTVPQFFKKFTSPKSTYEVQNFILEPEENSKSRLAVFTDTHLANRTDDLNQFEQYFLPDIRQQTALAESENTALYALALGDLAWDEYWYTNSYSLADYAETMSGLDIPIYSLPGNHDNDPNISDDFLAAEAFRENIGPTYYSVNIGDIHYILMDDTLFHNEGGNVQDYETGFTDNQMKWLKADLETVPAGSTIMFCTHIQVTGRPDEEGNFTYNMPAQFRTQIFSWLDGYNVHFLSGHTHVNYTNRISDSMVEHNLAAVCGTWWWTGYYSGNKCRINGDGTPSGYKIFDIDGNDIKWHFKALDRDKSYQFRAYDLKNCLITRELYCPESKTNVSDSFFSQYANGWDKAENTTSTNKVLINVFDYGPGWEIEVTENGVKRNVTRIEGYDPLHTVLFNMARMNSGTNGSTSMTFPTGLTSHLFEVSTANPTSSVVIKVTDPFGNIYQETMTRPRLLYDMKDAADKW